MCAKLPSVLAAGTVALLLSTAPALAEMLNFSANLIGAAEVPPNESTGAGTVVADYDTDTKLLKWMITFEGLTGSATAAHFHGPAAPDENAPPVVPIEGTLASPTTGEATLTDDQAADLQAGKWYFNIHTAQYPDGELRGQLPAFAQAQ
jgi:hypothetical protein